MVRVTRVNKMSKLQPQVKRALKEYLYDLGEKVIKEYEKNAKALLNLTLENRRGSSGFNDAKPTVYSSKVTKTKTGIEASMRVVVTDLKTSRPHAVYHMVSGGTRNVINKKTYVHPIQTIEARTSPRKLVVDSHKGFGGFTTAKKGEMRRGIKPRYFYSTTVLELRKRIQLKQLNKDNIIQVKIITNED